MSRSTFSILPYINRQKVKADGTANILCRITVDGKSAAISTGISCTPQEWNAKKGEVRNARDNGRLASFLAEVKDKYNLSKRCRIPMNATPFWLFYDKNFAFSLVFYEKMIRLNLNHLVLHL